MSASLVTEQWYLFLGSRSDFITRFGKTGCIWVTRFIDVEQTKTDFEAIHDAWAYRRNQLASPEIFHLPYFGYTALTLAEHDRGR